MCPDGGMSQQQCSSSSSRTVKQQSLLVGYVSIAMQRCAVALRLCRLYEVLPGIDVVMACVCIGCSLNAAPRPLAVFVLAAL